jgi:hypothetical protein
MQVLEQLPEGVAIAVLSAPSASLDNTLSVLPANLHPLDVEATSFSIHCHRSIILDFDSPVERGTAIKLLHAATSVTSSLRKIDLRHIPLKHSECLV